MTTDNAEQIEYWNGQAGQTWVAAQQHLDAMLAPISRALLERADPRAGERVVDVGCGCGDTTLAVAARGAAVWGIDISEPMLAHARDRAADVDGVAFSRTDAATAAFTPDHQLVISRFGVMFFADPRAAFTNIRTALAPGGRLCFVCWQSPRDNPWVSIAGAAIRPFLPEPAQAPDPREPGPFAFAEQDYVHDILNRAGYREITVDPLNTNLHVADDVEGALDFMQQVGPLSRALADLDEQTAPRALDTVRQALASHATSAGLDLGAACWLVCARSG